MRTEPPPAFLQTLCVTPAEPLCFFIGQTRDSNAPVVPDIVIKIILFLKRNMCEGLTAKCHMTKISAAVPLPPFSAVTESYNFNSYMSYHHGREAKVMIIYLIKNDIYLYECQNQVPRSV